MQTDHLVMLVVLTALLLTTAAPLRPDSVDEPGAIIVRNEYWAKPGLEDEVYAHRLHASAVRARLGLATGRVLRRLGDAEDRPDVVWECEYSSLEAREADISALHASGEFKPVMEKMGTLIDRFERSVWRVASGDE